MVTMCTWPGPVVARLRGRFGASFPYADASAPYASEHLFGQPTKRSGAAMRVLGVDPGLTRCGLGVVSGDPGRRLSAVAYGVVRTPPTDDIAAPACWRSTSRSPAWISEHRPELVAVERVFSQHNVRTVMGTAQAAAVAITAAARAGVPVAVHTPSEVKAAVTGNGTRGQGAGGRDGHSAARARCAADPGRHRRRARAGDLRGVAWLRAAPAGAEQACARERRRSAGDRERERPGRRRRRRCCGRRGRRRRAGRAVHAGDAWPHCVPG